MQAKSYTFNSKIKSLGYFAFSSQVEQVKHEPMFFNCDAAFAGRHGGPITRAFLGSLPSEWYLGPLVFDSRVHMLMPGWWPAIPGYHHDDVPRTAEELGQPDYDLAGYKSEHIMGMVGGDICPTRFAIGTAIMPAVPRDYIVYDQWNKEVVSQLQAGKLQEYVCADRTMYQFDWQSFHTAVKATGNGWRWFGRVSRNTDRINHITNEIRANAQVYLEHPAMGW